MKFFKKIYNCDVTKNIFYYLDIKYDEIIKSLLTIIEILK